MGFYHIERRQRPSDDPILASVPNFSNLWEIKQPLAPQSCQNKKCLKHIPNKGLDFLTLQYKMISIKLGSLQFSYKRLTKVLLS